MIMSQNFIFLSYNKPLKIHYTKQMCRRKKSAINLLISFFDIIVFTVDFLCTRSIVATLKPIYLIFQNPCNAVFLKV